MEQLDIVLTYGTSISVGREPTLGPGERPGIVANFSADDFNQPPYGFVGGGWIQFGQEPGKFPIPLLLASEPHHGRCVGHGEMKHQMRPDRNDRRERVK